MEVAIIGGGIAGLEAARVLAEHHVDVTLLEGSDRVGGRIRTVYEAGEDLPIELGPEYVHGDPDILEGLARGAPVALDDTSATYHALRDGRLVEADDLWKRFGELLAPVHDLAQDRSARDYLDRARLSPNDADLLGTFIEGFYGATLDTISIKSVADDAGGAGDDGANPRTRDGYGRLVGWLVDRLVAHRVPIALGRVVRAIDWRGDRVVIDAGEDVVARRAIITLPLGVLQAGDVRFAPALGDHGAALARLAMGQVVKVVLSLRAPIWRDVVDDLSFVRAHGQPFPTCWVRSRGGSHHVTAWAGGPHARALAALSRDHVVDRAVTTFAACLGVPASRLATAVRAAYTHDFGRDPFVRGAYSYARPGGLDAPAVLERPLADRLVFAGEATSGPYEGTVTGALASGARAAGQILRMRA